MHTNIEGILYTIFADNLPQSRSPQEYFCLEVIEEGEEKFQVTLSEEEKQKILGVMKKIKELGLDPEKLLDQAKDLYSQYGDELINNASESIKNSFMDSVKEYYSDFVTTVKDFFSGLFS